MKLLCLHGRGTSASIFEGQTAALRAKLGPSYQFDFVDAPFRNPPAPGIDVMFSSDTFAWWPDVPSFMSIRAAHLWLEDYIASHGPYDALVGFSQGCSLINTYLMSRGREHSQSHNAKTSSLRLPFGGVINICGSVSLPWLEELGVPVPAKAREVDARTSQALQRKAERLHDYAANPEKIRRGFGLWDDTSDLVHTIGAPLPPDNDVFGLDFTKIPDDIISQLPSIHVYGSKDPRMPSGIQLAYFSANRTLYDHGGGHDIPRTTAVSQRLAELVKQLEAQIQRAKAV